MKLNVSLIQKNKVYVDRTNKTQMRIIEILLGFEKKISSYTRSCLPIFCFGFSLYCNYQVQNTTLEKNVGYYTRLLIITGIPISPSPGLKLAARIKGKWTDEEKGIYYIK